MKEKFLEILDRKLDYVKSLKDQEEYESVSYAIMRSLAALDTVHMLGIITNDEYSELFDRITNETFC